MKSGKAYELYWEANHLYMRKRWDFEKQDINSPVMPLYEMAYQQAIEDRVVDPEFMLRLLLETKRYQKAIEYGKECRLACEEMFDVAGADEMRRFIGVAEKALMELQIQQAIK